MEPINIVFAIISKEIEPMLPYSISEREARWYADFLNLKKYNIQEFREEDIDGIAEKNDLVASEIVPVADGDLFMTEDDLEFVSTTAEDECQQLYMGLKRLKPMIKVIKGKSAKKLLDAIKEFFDERIPSEEFTVDENDPVDRLYERLKLKKFSKTLLRSTRVTR